MLSLLVVGVLMAVVVVVGQTAKLVMEDGGE
jgi:hypothetical protein